MSETAIYVENLGKLFYINTGEPKNMLREVITSAFLASLRKFKKGFQSDRKIQRELWALKDVSFEIKKGEVVGVIGRNGAGKSTLLKILSRITPPTEGLAKIHGRVTSLLEIGTGFHTELTGRENIFLNGVLLGMKRKEIKQKFDEIIAFAEIEKFIDTPVKHYSSGMYVRLAFAVAAHLEPEILLIDEVLAVGDSVFQKKCLGKMGDVAKGGRTVLFVTHQLNQIRRLCERCIWLGEGRLKKIGSTIEVIGAYESAMSVLSKSPETHRDSPDSSVAASFFKWEIISSVQQQPNVITELGPVSVRFYLKVNSLIRNGSMTVFLYSSDNLLIWGNAVMRLSFEQGIQGLEYTFATLPLKPGSYYWQVNLYDDNGLVDVWDCFPALVVATPPLGYARDEWAGILNIPCTFDTRAL